MEHIQKLLKTNQPIKWLFYGDSITHGSRHTFGHRDYTQHFTERVRNEMGRHQDIVINTAVSGNTTVNLLDQFEWRAGQFKPHIAFLMIGMNDCSDQNGVSVDLFKSNLLKLCDLFKKMDTFLILQTTCPILPGTAPEREPQFPQYMDAIREVAKQTGSPLIDHTRSWQEQFKQNPSLFYFWMSDAFHPNHYGHLVFAKYLLKELGIDNPDAPIGRFFHP
jgi:acyl-CoA thioesterase-1